jgi:hypothetical protein
MLEKAPKRSDRPGDPGTLERAARALWRAPNEAIGWAVGGLGHAIGSAEYGLGLTDRKPRIVHSAGKIEFVNNPLVPLGAVTFGHTTSFFDDPYDADDYRDHWEAMEDPRVEGHTVFEHEAAHMPQSDQLGPLYLPSNLLGGLYGLLRDRDWHGDHNWNERGPRSNPPRPWAPIPTTDTKRR